MGEIDRHLFLKQMEHLIDSRSLPCFYIVRAKLQRSSYPSIKLPYMQNHVVSMIKSYLKERHDQI